MRELTASLEAEKTKNKQLAKSCHDVEAQLLKERKSKKELFADDDEGEYSDDEHVATKISLNKENKELKEKLNQMTHKMMEFKSQSECAKQDLAKCRKVLERELGDNVDMKAVLAGNGNWKGRQQQIRLLQAKVRELKEQVNRNNNIVIWLHCILHLFLFIFFQLSHYLVAFILFLFYLVLSCQVLNCVLEPFIVKNRYLTIIDKINIVVCRYLSLLL